MKLTSGFGRYPGRVDALRLPAIYEERPCREDDLERDVFLTIPSCIGTGWQADLESVKCIDPEAEILRAHHSPGYISGVLLSTSFHLH